MIGGTQRIVNDGETIARPVLAGSTFRKWVVTVHDDIDDKLIGLVIERAEALYANGVVTYCFIGDKEQSDANGERTSEAGGRVQYHYHMVIHFAERVGLRWIANNFSNPMGIEFGGDNGGVYWLSQKGTDEQAVGYARKYEDSRKLFELGTLVGTEQGKRTDIDKFKELVMKGDIASYDDALDLASTVAARSKQFVLDYIFKHGDPPPVVPAGTVLRVWQHHLVDFVKSEPDDRSVLFFVCKLGNSGKSWLSKYASSLMSPKIVNVIPCGRVQDTCTQIDRRADVIIMDIPREITSNPDKKRVQYQVFEQIKNGAVFDSKFNSQMKRLKPVHLIVFMNEQPDRSMLSEDRYNIVNMDTSMNVPYSAPVVLNFGSAFSSDMTGDGPSALSNLMTNLGQHQGDEIVEEPMAVDTVMMTGNNPIYRGTLLDVNSTGHKWWAWGALPGVRTPVDEKFTVSTVCHGGMREYAKRTLNYNGVGSIRFTIDLDRWPSEQMVFSAGVDMMTGFDNVDPAYMTPEGSWSRLVPHYPTPPGGDRMTFGDDHALRMLYGNITGNPRLAPRGYRSVSVGCPSLQDLRMYVSALNVLEPKQFIASYEVVGDDGQVIKRVAY